ncbi:Y+L amino acid transporter 2-like [Portunus trituberculatus]|uniref:Y+L amino acid transporter 2-like n=1 Tax=Portunus trituberculatus TaxID=210409 RepID=UPI001E1CDED8|nr:Y+L amino acid transporter 2-like [Portunus trituberculatus]
MRRELNLADSIIVLIGIISGSGIFISANGVLQYSGSVGLSLLVWVLSGFISLIGGFVYTELAAMIPSSGGAYSYVLTAYGRVAAFVFLWMSLFLEEVNMMAIDALTFGTYVLQPFFPDSQTPPEIPVRLLAAVMILFLMWLNIRSVKGSVVLQNVLVFPKFIILGAIIIVGFYRLATSPSSSFNDAFANTSTNPATIATAFYQGLYTYNGWDNITCIVEELKRPAKVLVVAITTALVLLIALYLLVNVAYFAVLEPNEILFSPAVAVTYGRASFGVMAWSVPVFVALSTVGSLNGKTLTQSRVVFVGARHGQLPASLALVGNRCTPVTAIIFMALMALLYLVTVDIFSLINVVSFSSAVCQVGVVSALLHLRRKQPTWERPFKIWTVVAVGYLGVLVALVILPALVEPVTVGITVALIFFALVVYWLLLNRPITAPAYHRGSRRFYRFLQILLEVRPESDDLRLLTD